MGGIVPPTREERLGKRVIIIDRVAMLVLDPDAAPATVTRVLASDDVDEDGKREGVTMPIVGTLAETLASLAVGVPVVYVTAYSMAAGAMTA